MALSETTCVQLLMAWRTRISAATWIVVQDAHAAEDIFQNVVLKAMTRDVVFDSEGALLSWSFIAARREAIDWLRKHRRERQLVDAGLLEMLEQEWQQRPPVASGGKIEALRECLERAPRSVREMLRFRYADGCSCKEVAQRLGVGLDTVYQRLSRAHGRLRRCIDLRMSGPQRPEAELS